MRLETSKGKGIDNIQDSEVTDYDRQWDRYLASFHKKAVRRTEASGIYNCHGLVFASRRTKIDAHSQVQLVLDHDKYEEVPVEKVLPGDVVVYFSDKTGDANHSGVVVAYHHGVDVTPMICSKWGKYAEYIHGLLDCPDIYGPTTKYFRCCL